MSFPFSTHTEASSCAREAVHLFAYEAKCSGENSTLLMDRDANCQIHQPMDYRWKHSLHTRRKFARTPSFTPTQPLIKHKKIIISHVSTFAPLLGDPICCCWHRIRIIISAHFFFFKFWWALSRDDECVLIAYDDDDEKKRWCEDDGHLQNLDLDSKVHKHHRTWRCQPTSGQNIFVDSEKKTSVTIESMTQDDKMRRRFLRP